MCIMMNDQVKKPEGGLLQSREWMAVLRAEQKEIVDMHCGDHVLYGVEQKVPLVGKYLYISRVATLTDDMCREMCNLRYGWVRVDVNDDDMLHVMQSACKKIVKAPHDMQPRQNLIMNIVRTEDELLQDMKSKTRYNIRLAQKKGVKVFTSKEQKYIDIFYKLVKQTATRKKVSFHEKMHYEKIIAILPDENIQLYIAQYQDKILAVNVISFFGGVATYLHGATADENREVMAPFLLQWQAICDAKKIGCEWYDFGGVFSEDIQDDGKRGITRFKKGFAPNEKLYITKGSYDIVRSSLHYSLYRFLQKLAK